MERIEHAFAQAAREGEQCKVAVLVARDRIQRHSQYQGGKAAEQAEDGGDANVGGVLGNARELRGGPLPIGCLVEQDRRRQGDRDVCEVGAAGDPRVRPASHVGRPSAGCILTPFTRSQTIIASCPGR